MKKKTIKKGKQNQWADHLTQKAKADNYPARSVYKLIEIQKKFKIMKKGDNVIDFGCSPGSWLMYVAETIGSKGKALGIDLKKVDIKLPSNAIAYQGDILNIDQELALDFKQDYNVVLSDMAPATTGRKDIDAIRSFELCDTALKSACKLLVAKGNFVCKIFQGAEFKQFEKDVKSRFNQYKIFKPESCRTKSKEIYIIGINKKS